MTTKAVVTGVLAGLGDAAVQKLAVSTGYQSHFSFNEMLETGVTAGVGEAIGTFDHLPGPTEIAKQSLEIGTASVMTQLVEMEAGRRDKFEPGAVIEQVIAAALAPYISKAVDVSADYVGAGDKVSSFTKTAMNTTTNAVLGRGVSHTSISVENMAAYMIGTEVGNRVGNSVCQSLSNEDAIQNASLDSKIASRDKYVTSVFQSRTNHASYVDSNIMKAEMVANMSLPMTDIDWSDARYRLSEMNRQSMAQRWNATRGKSWSDVRSSRNDMVMPKGYDQIHDVTDFALGFGSSMFNGTLMGSTLESIRQTRENARAIIYGDSATRVQGVENFGKDIALTVGIAATGGIVGEVAEVMLPSISRIGLFSGVGVSSRACRQLKSSNFTRIFINQSFYYKSA